MARSAARRAPQKQYTDKLLRRTLRVVAALGLNTGAPGLNSSDSAVAAALQADDGLAATGVSLVKLR